MAVTPGFHNLRKNLRIVTTVQGIKTPLQKRIKDELFKH